MSRALVIASLAAAGSACSVASTTTTGAVGRECTVCHGDPARTGTSMAAPPVGTNGSTDPADLHVGAHQKHLAGGDGTRQFANGFACTTCHAIPSLDGHPNGHVDFAFSGLANGTTVDAASGTCSNVYCHGTASPVWNEPGSVACGSCHALPPAGGHPTVAGATAAERVTKCVGCHAETANADGTINLASGTHVNGQRDGGGGHSGTYGDPTVHGPDAIRFLQGIAGQCTQCHGADLNGGSAPSCGECHAQASALFPNGVTDWKTNCTFCHGTRTGPDFDPATQLVRAAPPEDVSGQNAAAKVGAHQKHLVMTTGVTTPFACETCHAVPAGFRIPPAAGAHLDGTALVTLRGAGKASLPADLGAYASGTCTTYCHGSTLQGGTVPSPAWSGGALACNACHGISPQTGEHPSVGGSAHDGFGTNCTYCHYGITNSSGSSITDKAAHLNGLKTVVLNPSLNMTWNASAKSCANGCHGSGNTKYWP